MGPLKRIYYENSNWEFLHDLYVKKVFEKIKNVERDDLYGTYILQKIWKDSEKASYDLFKKNLIIFTSLKEMGKIQGNFVQKN